MSVPWSFLIDFAGGWFANFCATCIKVTCGIKWFGDSIFMYLFAPEFVKFLWYAAGVYCHFVFASWSTVVCVSVTVRVSLFCLDIYYVEILIARVSNCSCPTDSKYRCTIMYFLWRHSDKFSTFMKLDV